MADTKFDAKSFNAEAFGQYVSRIPNLKRNELLKSQALKSNAEIRNLFSNQTTTSYARIPFYGNLDGTPVNYDGLTDITATSTKTYEQGVVSFGRAKAWIEKDFSYDITAGVDFMSNVAQQVSQYWEEIDQDILLSVIKGIFSMTGAENLKFVNNHTNNISIAETSNVVGATTLNNTIQKACKQNKGAFTVAFMHSQVATNLENLRLLEYMKYTDENGIQRNLSLATWNGRSIIIDDSVPTTEGYYDAISTTEGALHIVANSATPGTGEIKLNAVTPYFGTKTLAVGDYVAAGTQYVTYILGNGAFSYEDLGAKVPFEMSRDPKTNGGQDTLYTRQRKVLSPFGISYKKASQASLSPTNAEFEMGANWELINDGTSSYIDHKAIPIARLISRG